MDDSAFKVLIDYHGATVTILALMSGAAGNVSFYFDLCNILIDHWKSLIVVFCFVKFTAYDSSNFTLYDSPTRFFAS